MNPFDGYRYKIELHSHTAPVSGCSRVPPEDLVNYYKKIGYSALVVTNHMTPNYLKRSGSKRKAVDDYMRDFCCAYEAGKKLGIQVILGMEIRFEANGSNDYLVFGIDEDFIEKSVDFVPKSIEEYYPAMKNDRNLIIQAHPFREGLTLTEPQFVDGLETFNVHPEHNSRIGYAARCAFERPDMLVTAGTDTHDLEYAGLIATLIETVPEDSYQLAALLKTKRYLFQMGENIILPYGRLFS